jgi:serine/threonine protein kinase
MADIRSYEPLWGSWKIGELLGEGSFGKVYHATRVDYGKTYHSAIKIISIPKTESDYKSVKAELSTDDSVRSYFKALANDFLGEFAIMSQLQGHTNIVGYHDHVVEEWKDGIGFDIIIRMELLESLADYASKNPLDESKVIQLGIDMCKALEVCARHNIMHRDIKPENIFVTPHGEFKLGDFGIARQVEKTSSAMSKKGTPLYIAPEIFKGDEYGPNVDTYSLGLVLYRFLNGNRTPFLPDFPQAITPSDKEMSLNRRVKGEPLPPLKGAVNPALSAVVMKAASFERRNRYQSATEMREALEAASRHPNQNQDNSGYDSTIPIDQYKKPDNEKWNSGGSGTPKNSGKSEDQGPQENKTSISAILLTAVAILIGIFDYVTLRGYTGNHGYVFYLAYAAALFPVFTAIMSKMRIHAALKAVPLAVLLYSAFLAISDFDLPFLASEVVPGILYFIAIYSVCNKMNTKLTIALLIALIAFSTYGVAHQAIENKFFTPYFVFPLAALIGFLLGQTKAFSLKNKIVMILGYNIFCIIALAVQAESIEYNLLMTFLFAFVPTTCNLLSGYAYTKMPLEHP